MPATTPSPEAKLREFCAPRAPLGLQFSSAAQVGPGKTRSFARSMWDPREARKIKNRSGATTCIDNPETPPRQNPINPERHTFCPKTPLATRAKLESIPYRQSDVLLRRSARSKFKNRPRDGAQMRCNQRLTTYASSTEDFAAPAGRNPANIAPLPLTNL
jgi:hypothetical protein